MSSHKRCPFCGGKDLEMLHYSYDTCRVKCLYCLTEGPEAYHDLAAWEAWDMRAKND